MNTVEVPIVRKKIRGEWHSVGADEHVFIDCGPDDQRPDHDGRRFFKPVCIAKTVGGAVYDYYLYCGSCAAKMGSLGQVNKFCPWCGKGIGHYIFSMGVQRRSKLPEKLTVNG